MIDQGDWISLGEAASLLGVHPTTLRAWADQGEIASQRTPGGHRRFQRSMVEQWLATRTLSPNSSSTEAQLMIQSALGQARLQIGSGQLDGLPWYDRLDEQALQTHRELGRSLLELLTRYLAETEHKPALLHEVQRLGGEYARHTREQGLTLSETVQGFLFFRDLLADSVIQLAEILSLRSPSDWGHRLREVNHLTDELLLALIDGYDDKPG